MAALVASLVGGSAQAAQLTGSYSIAGGFVPVTLAGAPTPLVGADALDFVPTGETTPTPGTPGEFLVTGATADFANLVSPDPLSGQIKDISILAGGNSNYPVPPIAMFHQVGDLTFDLESFLVSQQDDEFITATGTGIFKRAGFEDTEGLMSFTAQTVNDVTFSWSSTQVAISVPEPATMLLMGLGLFGVAATVRRRRRRQ